MSVLLNIESKLIENFQVTIKKLEDEKIFILEKNYEMELEKPKDKSHGDYAINIAMRLTKELKKNPREIATIILENFNDSFNIVDSMEIAGPGFINIRLKDMYLIDVLNEVLEEKENIGNSDCLKGKNINVEFVSANPTGLLHMGNARGAAIGDTLANIMKKLGANVCKEYYINDAGKQIENFGLSLESRYLELNGIENEFPEDGYHGEDIRDTMKFYINEVEDKNDRLIDKSKEERIAILVEYALTEKINDIKETLKLFNVEFDKWYYESSLYNEGRVEKSLKLLREKDYVKEVDDALWLKKEALGEDKDEVLVRSNGVPTYFAADIAYHKDKFDRGYEELINVWGADHHGHVLRMQKALDCLGEKGDSLEVILMQLVRLFQGGEIVRMSKRTGTYVTLKELLDEVGVDAARYFFLMRNPDTHLEFDLDLAKSKSNENPIFYIQYAYARICSILRNVEEKEKIDVYYEKIDKYDLNDTEKMLLEEIAKYEKVLRESAYKREPYKIAKYAYNLAGAFHNFYSNLRVLNEPEDIRKNRIKIILATKIVLENILDIMGASAPERM